ncbi:MAG: response regulator [SAR324 cluster bacterium]|nr:response regulator [SAR324 cluster bacterium]
MNEYTIICVDDEREILDAVQYDLEPLASHFDLEAAESVDEAESVIDQMQSENRSLALVLCDHIMPGRLGVDFLIQLNQELETKKARKLLLTGQADLEATIEAVNQAGLHYFLAKPWDSGALLKVVIDQLTTFVIENVEEPLSFVKVLDGARIFNSIHENEI